MKYVREWAMEESKAGKGELPTENDYRASLYLARTIWAAMDEVISGAQGCLKWFAQVAKICAHMDGAIWWTTPTGFQVKQDYRKYKSRSVKTRIGDTIRQHKLRDDTEALDRRKMVNGLAPNYIHSLDASLLFKVVNAAAAQGVDQFAVVHDSFATLAADTECLAQAIRKSAADMFSEDLLGIFKKEVEALLPPDTKLPPLPKYGSLDPSGVRDSQYFFN
jgi:DNA-directed RNA polymerase